MRATNLAPSVDSIDADPTVVEGGGAVTLTPTVSDDRNAVSTYLWTSNGGGAIGNSAAEDTTWTAPGATASAQSITLTLTVTDAGGLSSASTVGVTVRAANAAPSIDSIGGTPTTLEGGGSVTLTADVSDDRDADADLTYLWTSNGGGAIGNSAAEDTTWTAPAATGRVQSITLTLSVTDTGGLSTSDAVAVTVRAAPSVSGVGVTSNPTAQSDTYGYGETMEFTLTFTEAVTVTGEPELEFTPGSSTALAEYDQGSGSTTLVYDYGVDQCGTDADGISIGSNALRLDANDTIVSTAYGTAAILTHSAPGGQTGHRVDGSWGTTPSVTVEVRVTDPALSTVVGLALTATVTDGQNNVTTYLWTSNGDGTFADAAAANTTWTAPAVTGTNRSVSLTLTVTDAGGLTGTAFRAVTVRTAPSVTVAASAIQVAGGGDLTLDGTARSPSGNLTYSWSSTGGGTFWDASAADTTWTAPAAAASSQSVTLTLTVTDTTTGLVTSYAVTVTGGRIPSSPVVRSRGPLPEGWEFPDEDGHFFHGTALCVLISLGLALALGGGFKNVFAGVFGLIAPLVVAVAIGAATPMLIVILVVVGVGGAVTFIFMRRYIADVRPHIGGGIQQRIARRGPDETRVGRGGPRPAEGCVLC